MEMRPVSEDAADAQFALSHKWNMTIKQILASLRQSKISG